MNFEVINDNSFEDIKDTKDKQKEVKDVSELYGFECSELKESVFFDKVKDVFISRSLNDKDRLDQGLVGYLKTNFSFDEKQKKEINKDKPDDVNDKLLNNNIFWLNSREDIRNDIKSLSDLYKINETKDYYKNLVVEKLELYDFDLDTKNDIISILNKEIDKSKIESSEYLKIKEGRTNSKLYRSIISSLNDLVVEGNRDYIYDSFIGKLNLSGSDKSNFEMLLKNTNKKHITTFAQALSSIENSNDFIEETRNQLKSYDKFPYSLINVSLQNQLVNKKFEHKIGEISKEKILDENNEKKLLDQIFYCKKNNIEELSIVLPKGNISLFQKVSDIAVNSNVFINVKEDPFTQNLILSYNEKKEIPQEPIHLALNNLNGNEIGDNASISDMLSKNIEMKKILEDQSLVIVGGKIFGSASRMSTDRNPKTDWNCLNNKNINISVKNQSNLVDDPKNSSITKNPSLAKDRALSFIDYFESSDKIRVGSSFDLSYTVDGPTKTELEQKGYDLEQMKDEFKKHQKATIDLNINKIVSEQKTISLDLQEKSDPLFLSFNISSTKPTSTSSSTGPSIDLTRIFKDNRLYNKKAPSRFKAIPCPKR